MITQNNRCAIYGSTNAFGKPDFDNNMEMLVQLINELVDKGINTFVTAANDGYELNAAKYITELKQVNSDVHLVIVRPYQGAPSFWRTRPILESVMRRADMVKYAASNEEEYFSDKLDGWIIARCDTIMCITNSQASKVTRLSGFDLTEKAMIYIPERIVPEPVRVQLSYPSNILADIYNVEPEELDLSAYPEDIIDRLEEVFERCLKDRELFVIKERYIGNKTLQVVGDHLEVSRERARQIQSKAIRKLKSKRSKAYLKGEELDLPKPNTGGSVDNPNAGSKWTDQEEQQLIDEFKRGYSISDIAKIHGRKPGGIRSRLKRLGLIDDNNNTPAELPNDIIFETPIESDQHGPYNGETSGIDLNEVVIYAEQTPGTAWFNNFEELKSYLMAGLEVYNATIYSLDNIEQARRDHLLLKTLRKKLTDKRKVLLEAYTLPIEVVLDQIDELIDMVKEPYLVIDRMLKINAKEIKRLDIMEYAKSQATSLGKYADKVINSPSFFNPRWCNASYREKAWTKDISNIINNARQDIEYILENGGDRTSVLLGYYFDKLSFDGIDTFLQNIEDETEHKPSEIVYIDTNTGEIVDAVETDNHEKNQEMPNESIVVTKAVKLTGKEDMINRFLDTAKNFGIKVE